MMKLGYLCKYVPVELLRAAGAEVQLMIPCAGQTERADLQLHANLCAMTRAAYEEFADSDLDGMILTNCCDSTRRLYDGLRDAFPDKIIRLIHVPHASGQAAEEMFSRSLEQLMDSMGLSIDSGKLQEQCSRHELPSRSAPGQNSPIQLAVIGARLSPGVREMIEEYNVDVRNDFTCTETRRSFALKEEDIPGSYAKALLQQLPCLRMTDLSLRTQRMEDCFPQIDGIIYHTMKFCDMYSYEFMQLNRQSDIPVLKLETDSSRQSSGQIRTRLEAFLESLAAGKGMQVDEIRKRRSVGMIQRGKQKIVMGLDSGSTSTNAVIMNSDKKILASVVVRTGARSGDSADQACAEVIRRAGLQRQDVDRIISTGYGRVTIPFADRSITEISCHGRGAHYFFPEVRTILDIGGQDSKAIRLNERGEVLDFAMNDKCAAGTGRFLEMMAVTLGLTIDELGPVSMDWNQDIDITNMCTVFAESEVISLIADNRNKADIVHGLHKSIASRVVSLIRRVHPEPAYMMTGGVAKNRGAVAEIEKKLGHSLMICDEPEIVGAVGAAIFGLEEGE